MPSLDASLRDAARRQRRAVGQAVEPFASWPYAEELELKRVAVAAFLADLLPGPCVADELLPAPQPRGYRTTSRRRADTARRGTRLLLGDGARGASPLEPPSHGALYADAERLLGTLPQAARAVNHVILRGSYEELVLILNVRALDAGIVRGLRRVAERLRESHPQLRHAWLYHDPKRSRYYLELERPASGVGAKKLFGAAAWRQRVGALVHQVGVFSFSQVNLAMAPLLVETVRSHAAAQPEDVVFDLYCGYGLFGAALAQGSRRVVAVDADGPTVDNARHAIGRAGGKVLAVRQALRGADDVARIARAAQRIASRDAGAVVILDPPRDGTPAGLLTGVARHLQPRRAVQVFCGADEIGRSLREWAAAGYAPERVTPLDFFPGTPGIEVVVSVRPVGARRPG